MFPQQFLLGLVLCGPLINLSSTAENFRILGIASIPIQSHYVAIKPLFTELAAKGHDVTVINQYPNHEAVENFTDVFLDTKHLYKMPNPNLYKLSQLPKSFNSISNYFRHIQSAETFVKHDCFSLFTSEKIKQLIATQKFDVIILEHFVSDCGFVIASQFKPTPVIGILTHSLFPKHYPRIGVPFRSSVDPFYFSASGTSPTLLERFQILLADLAYLHYFDPKLRGLIKNSAKALLNINMDYLDTHVEDVRMLFVNQHFSLTGTRLKTDQIVDIGGMHLKENKPLPQGLKQFLDASPEGVILMSLGSIVNVNSLPKEKVDVFLDAFEKIPQKVIMKWESGIENRTISDKILLQSWLPQADILCHPNVVGFIYHGGMLGTSESLQCAVPMIVIPLFADQIPNSAVIRESGLGVSISFQDISVESLTDAVQKITSPESRQHVHQLSRAWRDRPLSALDTAVYWTEYVARHGNRYPVDAPSKKVSSINYYNIDLFVIVAFLLLILTFVVYKFVHLVVRAVICISHFKFTVKANLSKSKKSI